MSDRKFRHEDGAQFKRLASTREEMTPNLLMDWLIETVGTGTEPIISPGVHVDWYSPKTEEEIADDIKYEAARKERTEKWERETYERLREIYEETK
jgi:hypothetical protein